MDNNYVNNRQNNNNQKKPKNINTMIIIIIAALLTFAGITMLNGMIRNATYTEIPYEDFIDKVKNTAIEAVELQSDRILIKPKMQGSQNTLTSVSYTYYTGYTSDQNLAQTLIDNGVKFSGYIPNQSSSIIEFIFVYVLPIVLIFGMFSFVYRKISKGGGMMGGMGVGKNTAKVYVEKQTGVTFKDVAGQEEAKESLT